MSARGEKQSFLTHCSLAIRADGTRRLEGVLAASYHVPTKATDGELQDRWLDHVREIHALGQAPMKTIHLMDPEEELRTDPSAARPGEFSQCGDDALEAFTLLGSERAVAKRCSHFEPHF